jgi:hypothetical protein
LSGVTDPRAAAIAAISLPSLTVRPHHGLVFLCGGKTNLKDTQNPACSIRDLLAKRLLYSTGDITRRVRMAEDIQDWSDKGVYQELVTFERHLAELASVIVIVLESAGSIAELGIFSTIEHHQDKLLIFVEESHYSKASFIKLGILDFLENTNKNRPEVYRWLQDHSDVFDHAAAEGYADELVDTVKNRANKPSKGGRFSESNWLHKTLLILELIGLFRAIERNEISDYLEILGVQMDSIGLSQCLFILERLDLIIKESRSGLRLYVRTDNRRFIDFGKSKKEFDWDAISFSVSSFYKDSQKKRFRIIQSLSLASYG